MIHKFSKPIDNSPLVVFRIIFGILITLEAWGAIATGWVKKTFIAADYTFPFIDFSWLKPLPGDGMYYYFIVMGCAGIMVMLGWFYRIGIGVYTVMWAGMYFMQKTSYNNHYYLLLILLGIMCLVPAHKYASLDASRKPAIKSSTCPQWCIWIFVTQIAVVYFYASVAKMHADWVNLKALSIWFHNKRDYFLVGPLLQERWFQYAVAYGGIVFDLLIVPGLLWQKTRKAAFVFSIFFHMFNSVIFQVGIFPYLAISWALFFFPPEMIRKVFLKNKPAGSDTVAEQVPFKNQLIIYVLLIHLLVQLALPLRHHFYPGNVNWTEEGHRLSWRMMLRTKNGHVRFNIVDLASRESWTVNPKEYVDPKQARMVACYPDICWQFVQILKKDMAHKGFSDVQIFAVGKVSLNGDAYQPLYNPATDLSKVEWQPFSHSEWLLLSE